MILSLALFALTASATPPPAAAVQSPQGRQDVRAKGHRLQVYDLSVLTFGEDYPDEEVFLPSLRWSDEETSSFEEARAGDVGHFVALIQTVCEDELSADGCGADYSSDDRLFVVGPPSLHQRVQALLNFFSGLTTSAAVLQLDVVRRDDLGRRGIPCLIDAGQVQALIDGALSHSTHVLHVPAGRAARAETGTRRDLVLDYDIEIAQGVAIFDPIMGDFFEGLRATVRAAPAEGGLFVALIAKRGDWKELLPNKDLGMTGFVSRDNGVGFERFDAALQSPVVTNRSCAVSAFLPVGKALVLSSAGNGETTTDLLILRQTGGELPARREFILDAQKNTRLVFADLGAIGPPSLRAFSSGLLSGLRPSTIARADDPSLGVRFHGGDDGIVTSSLGGFGRGSRVEVVGPWLVIRPELGVRDDVEVAAVQESQLARFDSMRSSTRQFQVDLRVHYPNGIASTVIRLPLRAGCSGSVVSGLEQLEVLDYDVEVAQGSAIPDPVVTASFQGVALWLRATPTPGGHLLLEVRGSVSDREDAGLEPTTSRFFDYLDQSVEGQLVLRESRNLPAQGGGWRTVLGDPAGGVSVELTIQPL